MIHCYIITPSEKKKEKLSKKLNLNLLQLHFVK